jgi:hypothetical protein
MATKKRPTSLIVSAVVIVVTVIVTWMVGRANDKSLMRKARLVAHLQGWQRYSVTEPQWITDHEALYLAYREDGDRFEFTHLNTDTSAQMPMATLNNEFEGPLKSFTFSPKPDVESFHYSPEIVISPLRNRLLIARSGMGSLLAQKFPVEFYVTDLDAKQVVHWDGTDAEEYGFPPHWLSDGKRWIMQDSGPNGFGTTLFDVAHPGSGVRLGSNVKEPANWTANSASIDDCIWGVVSKPGPIDENKISAAEWNVLGKSPLITYQIKTPVPGVAYLETCSPKHHRVAWLIYYSYMPQLGRLIHRLFPSVFVRGINEYGIWVSDLDGRNMVEIGHDPISGEWPAVRSMQWLPGEKDISFMINEKLYTVPVDRQ